MYNKSTLIVISSLLILSNCGESIETMASLTRLNHGTNISRVLGPASAPKKLGDTIQPPAGYVKQHWVHPNACSYSRAQAPGYKPTWHLILNPYHIGQPPAHAGCATMITQEAWTGGYVEKGIS